MNNCSICNEPMKYWGSTNVKINDELYKAQFYCCAAGHVDYCGIDPHEPIEDTPKVISIEDTPKVISIEDTANDVLTSHNESVIIKP